MQESPSCVTTNVWPSIVSVPVRPEADVFGATVNAMLDGPEPLASPGWPYLLTIGGLSLVTLAMTIGAEPLFELTSRGARQLLQRDEYVRAVLGGAR